MNPEPLQGAVSLIREGRSFGVVSHVDPDGDSAGSLLASMLMLKRLGKEAVWLQNQPIPGSYDFLPGYDLAAPAPSGLDATRLRPGELDCVIVLDSPCLSRVAWDFRDESIPANAIINIDHHKDNALFGHVNVVDGLASSASELLFGVIEEFGLGTDVEIATNIYTGISTDTGSFSYSNTTPQSLRTAARLVEAGVDVAYVARHLQCDFTLPRLTFLGKVLASAQSNEDGSIVWMVGTERMRRNADFWGSTEQFANHAMRIRDAQVAMFFLQDGAGHYKVSIRTRGQLDAGLLAGSFGGGGHERAAGCRVEGNLESIISDMVEAADLGLKEAAGSSSSAVSD
ncbi:MAG: bifunctional oligoribonuclease/PAP phosphatase NrnA [Candidatus Coatesbacteria bacterium]|nr:bifunctional oligoribonuclease/PAP phosphatase NrnA [Candidatus Coatesbacteria bacterium]